MENTTSVAKRKKCDHSRDTNGTLQYIVTVVLVLNVHVCTFWTSFYTILLYCYIPYNKLFYWCFPLNQYNVLLLSDKPIQYIVIVWRANTIYCYCRTTNTIYCYWTIDQYNTLLLSDQPIQCICNNILQYIVVHHPSRLQSSIVLSYMAIDRQLREWELVKYNCTSSTLDSWVSSL